MTNEKLLEKIGCLAPVPEEVAAKIRMMPELPEYLVRPVLNMEFGTSLRRTFKNIRIMKKFLSQAQQWAKENGVKLD